MEIALYFTNVKSFCLCKSCIKGKLHKDKAPQEGAIRTSLLQVSIIHFHIYMLSNAMNCPCKLFVKYITNIVVQLCKTNHEPSSPFKNTNLLLKLLLGRKIQTFKNDNKDEYKFSGHFIEFVKIMTL